VSGVEYIEVSVFDSLVIKVGGGIGFHLKQGGILGFTLASSPNQVSFFFSGMKTDVFGYFRLILLIREDKRIVPRIASIKEGPSLSRMCGILKFHT